MRKKKAADQLCGNRTTDQRLCFRYMDSTIPLLPKAEISSLSPSSVTAQPSLCRTWSETPKTGFLRTRLIAPSEVANAVFMCAICTRVQICTRGANLHPGCIFGHVNGVLRICTRVQISSYFGDLHPSAICALERKMFYFYTFR